MFDKSANQEARRQRRRRTLKSARILIDQTTPLECVVRNLSDRGALVMIWSFAVPGQFDLVLESERTRHSCRVVWRALDRVGVEFENSRGADPSR